ncbi:MAG TPA: hypothetical protein VKA46_28605 [Gemmataceae bacterium]|nr:hypothetical protein [Gemmataceae bacterium]
MPKEADPLDRAVEVFNQLPAMTRRPDQDDFDALVREWRATRGHTSSAAKMAKNAAYQRIIAMGNAAVPLILAELRKQPDHWFLAINAITGANPVPPGSRTVNEMVDAWLTWGAANGYIS